MSRTRWPAALVVAGVVAGVAACAEPAPDATPTRPDVRSNTLAASVAAKYSRTAVKTPLGDPVTVDVCAIAAAATTTTVTLTADPVANAAACTLSVRTTRDRAGVSVALRPTARAGVRARLRSPSAVAPGVNVYNYAYEESGSTCTRAIQIYQAGLQTVWATAAAVPDTTADVAQACDTASRVRSRVESLAARHTTLARLPRLDLPARSLLELDTCKVAAAGRVGSVVGATGAGVANSYRAGCRFAGEDGSVDLVSGTLRDGARLPGADRVVDRRRLRLQPLDAPSCAVAAQLGREVVTSRFTGTGSTAPADCAPAAAALVAYLDVLDG